SGNARRRGRRDGGHRDRRLLDSRAPRGAHRSGDHHARVVGDGSMGMTYVVHIATGILGVIAGFVALYSAKGALVHRRSGMLFVYAMLVMSVAGMTIAVVRGKAPEINVPAGLITSYMVITSLTTV